MLRSALSLNPHYECRSHQRNADSNAGQCDFLFLFHTVRAVRFQNHRKGMSSALQPGCKKSCKFAKFAFQYSLSVVR